MLTAGSKLLFVAVWAAAAQTATFGLCPHQASDLQRWSAPDTWPSGAVPAEGEDVTISSPVLLDTVTPDLALVTLEEGGRLVFDPDVSHVQLTAHLVVIDGGELWIGAEDCPFDGQADVELIGRRDEHPGVSGNQKAVLVVSGTLEVHGQHKLPWTRLASTVQKTTQQELSANAVYDVGATDGFSGKGYFAYEFTSTGESVRDWGRVLGPRKFERMLTGVNPGNVVVVLLRGTAKYGSSDSSATADAFESFCYGGTENSAMRELEEGEQAAWVAVCHAGSPENSVEELGTVVDQEARTSRLVHTIGSADFVVQSGVKFRSGTVTISDMATFVSGNAPTLERILTLTADVSTWEVGDTIILASTDYDFEQAERFIVQSCPECSSYQVKIKGKMLYTHWGEVTDGVDMMGEVADLTRNVRFHGRMESECYGDNLCDKFDFDTFGGQVKMLRNFDVAKIENAELFDMGQQAILGTYPIHYHMCLDTSSKETYVRSNAIHDTFLRCVTIHGSHNVTLQDNVGVNSLGHCFFLEDGGEQHNSLIGNLGMVTREGFMIPTDRRGKTSTFWITNPDNDIVNNAAAGSEGMGIWILMPKLPTGQSEGVDMGLVSRQAEHTKVRSFVGNVVHSSVRGFRLDDELKRDGTVSPFRYQPLVDPTDRNSEAALLELRDLTAYKNFESVWIKSLFTVSTNFRIADSVLGFTYGHARETFLETYPQILEDSLIVGDTANKGEPAGRVRLPSGEVVVLDRSYPSLGNNIQHAQIGVAFFRGPVLVRNTTFGVFKADAVRSAGAIGKKLSNPYFASPANFVRDITFTFTDPAEGSRFYDGDTSVFGYKEKDGNRHIPLVDWDGSLTTYPGATLIRPLAVHVNARCTLVPSWGPGTALCPDRFTRVRPTHFPKSTPTFITRNDLQAAELDAALGEQQLSYSLNSAESYIMHFNTTVPERIGISSYGVEQGVSQKFGVCIGADQEFSIAGSEYSEGTMEEVDADDANSKYFYDAEAGVMFFRFTNPYPRLDTTTSHCPGPDSEEGNSPCPSVTILMAATNEDGDCRSRAYPTYATQPVSAEGALTPPF